MAAVQAATQIDDYEAIRAAIAYLSEYAADALDLPRFARALGLTERQFVALFHRWCGLTPKSFAQAVALDHARRLLRARENVLDTTYAVGLSAPSRLHDLFVSHEAMPPGVFRDRGAGLDMVWGAAPSPFGTAVLVVTDYGLAGIGFADNETPLSAAVEDLQSRWPNARFSRADAVVAPLARRIFDPARWDPHTPLRVVLIGTDFEIRVWESLLAIPVGGAMRYAEIAAAIGRPTAARAVGAAIGKNPISFVVPCHRVVGAAGGLTGYHWGLPRKRAMLGWEVGVTGG